MEFLQNALMLLIAAAVALLMEVLRRQLGFDTMRKIELELQLEQDLALVAVKYAEQAYRGSTGPAKYVHASEWLSTVLEARGMRVSPENLRVLIEWALREIRDEFGDQWGKSKMS